MAAKKTAPKAEKKKSAPKKEAKAKKKTEAKAEKAEAKPDKRIKGILFDFWGTIVENGTFPSPVKKVRYFMKLDMPFSEYIVAFEEEFMTSTFNDLYEGFTKVCNKFGVDPDRRLLDILVGTWNKNKMFARPYDDTFKVLEELKKSCKIALIANTDCFSIKEVMQKYDMEKYFDAVVLSYETGMLKSNPGMFDIALKKLGLKKDEVIMVGDSIQSDMKSAERAGVKSVLIDRRCKMEYPEKVASLEELKKFLE